MELREYPGKIKKHLTKQMICGIHIDSYVYIGYIPIKKIHSYSVNHNRR